MTRRSLVSVGELAALMALLALIVNVSVAGGPINCESERRGGEGVHAAPYAGRPA